MNCMIGPVFVDTNVFVYARDSSQATKQPLAMEHLAVLWREERGRISTQVLSELYVTLTRKLRPGMRPDEAWDDIQALVSWSPQPIDSELLLLAREIEGRYRLNWWDSMIVAAAQVQDCATLLSEDFQDGMCFGSVRVHKPFTPRMAEESGDYTTGIARRHRRPGRPRRGATGAGS